MILPAHDGPSRRSQSGGRISGQDGPYIGQGQFRSKSPEGIKQEIHALVLFLAIARVLMATAAKVEREDY